METKEPHFEKIFWFCVATEIAGIMFLAALIWIPVPSENQSMANIAIGFITATVIGIPLSYLLGGNLPQQKKSEPGTTNIELSATSTTKETETDPKQ